MNFKHICLWSCCFLVAGMASASEILVEFDFENGTPAPVNNASATNTTPETLATHFSVSGLTGFFYQDNGGFFRDTMGGRHATAIRTGGVNVTDTSTFTTAGTDGATITYESFSGFFSANTGNIAIDISYSIDGAPSVPAGSFDPTDGSPLDDSGSAFDFADFSTSKSVVWTMTFTAQNTSNDRMRFDDLVLTGTIIRGTVISVQ